MNDRHKLLRLLLVITITFVGSTPVFAKDVHQDAGFVVRLAGMDAGDIGSLEQQGIHVSRITDGSSVAIVNQSQLSSLRAQGLELEVLKSDTTAQGPAVQQAADLSNEYITLSVVASGQFTMRTSDGRYLLYPSESTGYLSVNVDGNVYTNDDGSLTVATPFTVVDDTSAYIAYETPQQVLVTQRFLLSGEAVRFEVEASNQDGAQHDVSIRYLFDTQVDLNDGSPLYAPTVGVRTYETDMPSPSYHSWRGYDIWPDPTLTSIGTFSTQPDRAVFAWWPEAVGHQWAYDPDPNQQFYTPGSNLSPESDSCVLLYFSMGTLDAGGQDEIATYYGVGEPEAGTDRERLISAFESFKEAIKASVEADVDAFSALQAKHHVSLRNEFRDYLEVAVSLLTPDIGDVTKLGKGAQLLLDTAKVLDYVDMGNALGMALVEILDTVPASASETEIKNDYIREGYMENLPITLPSGDSYEGINDYLEAIDSQFEAYVAEIPDPLPADYPLDNTISILDQQTAALNASTAQEVYVPVIYETMCELVKLGVLQNQEEGMKEMASKLGTAENISFWTAMSAAGTWVLGAGLKLTGVVVTPVSVGSSLVVTESIFWSGVASLSTVQGLLSGAGSARGMQLKVAMTMLAYRAVAQLAVDLSARYAVFEHTSEWVTAAGTESATEGVRSQAESGLQLTSITVPDLAVSEDQAIGQGTGQALVENTGSLDINVNLYGNVTARVGDEVATVGLLDASSASLAPGEQTMIPFDYTVLRSSFLHHTGYDVHTFITAMDSEGAVEIVGPFVAHFFAGTASQLAELSRQTHSTVRRGTLNVGQVVSEQIEFASGTESGCLLLSFAEGADQDLHLYDGAGNHVGVNYSTGEVENQIPGAAYSAATTWPEWIRIENPGSGAYQVEVVGQDSTAGDGYDLSMLESPALPAILDSPPRASWSIRRDDAELTVTESFGLPISESGGSQAVSNLQLSVTDFHGDAGATLAASQISCDAPDEVPAGGAVMVQCVLTIDPTIPPGDYTGSIEIGGNALSGSPLATSSQVVLTVTGESLAVGGVTRPVAWPALLTGWWALLLLLGVAVAGGLAFKRRVG